MRKIQLFANRGVHNNTPNASRDKINTAVFWNNGAEWLRCFFIWLLLEVPPYIVLGINKL